MSLAPYSSSAFTTETLPDAALDVLVEFIADAPTRAR
jgi:hypothetical protein